MKHNDNLIYVDVCRGVAILMVILVHTAQGIPGLSADILAVTDFGQLGVQLFFVASAWTLSRSADADRRERYPIVYFFIRRYFRIAPLYYVGILVYFVGKVLAAKYYNNSPNISHYSPWNIIANLLFFHGLVRSANNSIVPGGWSIGTEMLFYAVLPAIFPAIKLFYQRVRPLTFKLVSCVFVLFFGGLLYLVQGALWSVANNSFEYFSLLTQAPVFVCGIVLYFWMKDVNISVGGFLRASLLLASLLLSLMLFQVLRDRYISIVPFVCGILFSVFFALLGTTSQKPTVFSSIGRLSYSIYICHFVFIYYFLPLVVRRSAILFHPLINLLIMFFSVLCFSYMFARIAYFFIEKPGIEAGRSLIRRIERSCR